jgi:uncharacterized membrane protein YidH (DUF202 family)
MKQTEDLFTRQIRESFAPTRTVTHDRRLLAVIICVLAIILGIAGLAAYIHTF